MWAAMRGSLDEAQKVLAEREIALDVKTVRAITYRYVARASLVQQTKHCPCEETVAGRRVEVSGDGGIRLRANARQCKTQKGRIRTMGVT
jgi:hypothetical protein